MIPVLVSSMVAFALSRLPVLESVENVAWDGLVRLRASLQPRNASDAIALALRMNSPIFVEEGVVEKAQSLKLDENLEGSERLKKWLEKASGQLSEFERATALSEGRTMVPEQALALALPENPG